MKHTHIFLDTYIYMLLTAYTISYMCMQTQKLRGTKTFMKIIFPFISLVKT